MIKTDRTLPALFFSPCKIVFGLNTAGSVAEEIGQLGGGKILIVTDPGIVAGQMLGPIETSLKVNGVSYALSEDNDVDGVLVHAVGAVA